MYRYISVIPPPLFKIIRFWAGPFHCRAIFRTSAHCHRKGEGEKGRYVGWTRKWHVLHTPNTSGFVLFIFCFAYSRMSAVSWKNSDSFFLFFLSLSVSHVLFSFLSPWYSLLFFILFFLYASFVVLPSKIFDIDFRFIWSVADAFIITGLRIAYVIFRWILSNSWWIQENLRALYAQDYDI